MFTKLIICKIGRERLEGSSNRRNLHIFKFQKRAFILSLVGSMSDQLNPQTSVQLQKVKVSDKSVVGF